MRSSKKEALLHRLDILVRAHLENTVNFVVCIAALSLHCARIPDTDKDTTSVHPTDNEDNFLKQSTLLLQILQTIRSRLPPIDKPEDYAILKQIWSKEMYLQLYVAVESMKHLFAIKKLIPLVNQLTNGFNGLLSNDQFVSRLPNKNVEAKLVQWDALLTELHTLNHAWSQQILALHSTLNRLPVQNSEHLQKILSLSSLPPLSNLNLVNN